MLFLFSSFSYFLSTKRLLGIPSLSSNILHIFHSFSSSYCIFNESFGLIFICVHFVLSLIGFFPLVLVRSFSVAFISRISNYSFSESFILFLTVYFRVSCSFIVRVGFAFISDPRCIYFEVIFRLLNVVSFQQEYTYCLIITS